MSRRRRQRSVTYLENIFNVPDTIVGVGLDPVLTDTPA